MTSNQVQSGVSINPTLWGYVIEGPWACASQSSLSGRLRILAGLGSIVLMAGLLFLGSLAGDSAALAMRFGAAMFFGVLALILLRRKACPAAREVRIDRVRNEIIAGFRNADGGFVLSGSHGFDEVDGVVLLATDDAELPAQIMLRLADDEEALLVAAGEAQALEPLAERLARDLSAPDAGFDPVEATRKRHDRPIILGPQIEIVSAA